MNKFVLGLLSFSLLNFSVISAQEENSLQIQRAQVVKEYLLSLEAGDIEHMNELLEDGAIVVSTSQGKVDAKTFFADFLPHIVSGQLEIHQEFIGIETETDHYGVRFGLFLVMDDGWSGFGEYIDDFIFSPNSSKLLAVYMFENKHFE